jgi:hypothetical protein
VVQYSVFCKGFFVYSFVKLVSTGEKGGPIIMSDIINCQKLILALFSHLEALLKYFRLFDKFMFWPTAFGDLSRSLLKLSKRSRAPMDNRHGDGQTDKRTIKRING